MPVEFFGKIKRIVSERDTSCILLVLNNETKKTVCVKGKLLSPKENDELIFVGEFTGIINKYGQEEFDLDHGKLPPISDDVGMVRYLTKISSEKTAKIIFDNFGMDSINVLENEPDKILVLPRFSEKRLQKIIDKHKNFQQADVYIRLSKFLTDSVIKKGLEAFGNDFEAKLHENPYSLIELDGVAFDTADKIAIKMGFLPNDFRRIESGAFYEMQLSTNEGHCYLELSTLANRLSSTLRVSGEEKVNPLEISTVIKDMVDKKSLIQEENRIYIPIFYIREIALAKIIVGMVTDGGKALPFDVKTRLKDIEDEFKAVYGDGFEFGDQQKELFFNLHHNLLILRGDPGTGKTTTVRGAKRLLHWAFPDYDSLAVAPTGKASKRLSSSLSTEAVTIHRGLEFDPESNRFLYNEKNKLPMHIIFADEFSMADLFLAYDFFSAIEKGAKVIIIGDPNQLPSVGAGKVLLDMIESGIIPMVYLTEVFRQAMDSGIVLNAHAINRGEFPKIKTPKNDFRFVNCETPEDALQKIYDDLDMYMMFYDINDIQILCPRKDGVVGTENINKSLQQKLNPPSSLKREIHQYGTTFREGDKVIQMKNDFRKLNVCNGDTGIIERIYEIEDEESEGEKETHIDVNIDGRIVKYQLVDLRNLKLGYAITIHKSQGSEWPCVIIPITREIGILAKRNLLFTADTRAQEVCSLYGDYKSIYRTVKTIDTSKRNTTLAERLRSFYAEEIAKQNQKKA